MTELAEFASDAPNARPDRDWSIGGEGPKCDVHLHVFGPIERYPLFPGVGDLPRQPGREAYLAAARRLGLARFVFVQPSYYGGDNTCLLDALDSVGSERSRGVLLLPDSNLPTDGSLDRWHTAGVRGLRVICFPPGYPVHTARSGTESNRGWIDPATRQIQNQAAIAKELGWHLDLLAPGWLIVELLPVLESLEVEFALAHFGMFPATDGPDQPGFKALLSFLVDGPGTGWVKLTGPYRISEAPAFADVQAMARELVAAAPDRLVWGSDFPHLSFAGESDMEQLFELFGRWVPHEGDRRRVLIENPARLYDFDGHDAHV